MSSDLRSILGELYTIDPSLQDHEAELIPVLEAMMRSKPDVTPDEAFIQRLRSMLREKNVMVSSSNHDQKKYSSSSSFFSFFTMNHLQYTVTGVVLGAIIAGPITYSLTQSGGLPSFTNESNGTQKLFSYSVEDSGSSAFGDLSTVQQNTAYGRGGGGGAPEIDTAMSARPQSGGGGGDAMMIDPKIGLIAPEMTQYNLVFDGALPSLTDSVDVYSRMRGVSNADIGQILSAFNTGLIDLGSFGNAKTDMISFYQDTEYGYMVNVSFREGTININQNWEKWPHPESACRDEACYQRFRVKAEDVPADDVLIGIANAFVEKYSIDLSQYGEPEVNNQWRAQYEAATDKSMVWIPDGAQVIYPLLIDGKPVYDEGGMKTGISINVNVREKRVSDAWGIMDQKYRKSAYAGVTDEAAIRAFIDAYGVFPTDFMPQGTTVKSVDITLGTPEVSLVRMYHYRDNMSDELLVPALVFPVTNVPEGEYFYQKSITVPLAADLLKERTGQGNPVPMPLIMEDTAR